MASTTLFVNKTGDMVKMKVGNSQYSSDIASIEGGGEYRMHVNMNDTYREFMVGIGDGGKKAIVSSDDCCDYQCITIKEVNGEIDLLREPRQQATASVVEGTAAAKRPWFTWKLWV
ncbi:hypothetical protein M758_8G042500 [Ceratodon purpureus]|nr:hypothetical protein M758_8G042500 [Ceratodon purpureus]